MVLFSVFKLKRPEQFSDPNAVAPEESEDRSSSVSGERLFPYQGPKEESAGLTNAEVTEIYQEYGASVLRRCRRVFGQQAIAHDVFQEVFVRVMTRGAGLRNNRSKLAWLFTVCDRCCIDFIRRQSSEKRWSEAPAPEVTAQTAANSLETRDFLMALGESFDPRERLIAVLAFGDGLSQGEIADRLGYSRQTVNRKLQLIRQKALELEGFQ